MNFIFKLQAYESIEIIGGRRIAQFRTRYQKIEIVQLPGLGQTIFIDGCPQISEADSPIFNELIAHAAICAVPDAKTIFVAGVASGGAISELLKHSCVNQIYAIDIDEEAMQFYRRNLSFWRQDAVSDTRVKLIFSDARAVLADQIPDYSLDVIIIDLPDPHKLSPSRPLFTQEFYFTCRRKLKSTGVLLTQSGRFRLGAMAYHCLVRATCSSVFEQIKTYQFYYPCYYEPWSFLLCANQTIQFPSKEQIDQRLESHGVIALKYYSGAIDMAASEIPDLLVRAAAETRSILRDV